MLLINAVGSGVIFLLVWWVMSRVVFKPFLALHEEREQRTVGDESAAIEKRRETRQLQDRVEQLLREARLQGIEARDRKVDAAKREAQVHIDEAARQIALDLAAAQQRIHSLTENALRELPAEAERMAGLVIDKALLRGVGTTIH